MSGRRSKAIRKAFRRVTGRTPARTTWWADMLAYIPSEWRRLKKAALRARRAGLPFRIVVPAPRRLKASL